MIVVRNILTDLVEKRLWPVAALLVAALVAVPIALSRPGAPESVAVAPAPKIEDDTGPTLALTRSSLTGFARSPRVNDKRLDPFGARYPKAFEAALKRYLAAGDDVIDAGTGSDLPSESGGTTTDPGGSSGGGVEPNPPSDDEGTPKPTRTPKPQKPKTERDDVLSILLTDAAGTSQEITDIRTLSPLPDTANPFLVYVGKTADGKVTFLVSADVTVKGGSCSPSPTDCRTLVMKVGDTANFTYSKEGTSTSADITITDLETKNVVVGGDAKTDAAAAAEDETRALGARALKTVVRDEDVLHTLVSRGVKIRH